MIYKLAQPVNIGKVKLEDVGRAIDAIRAEHNGVCSPEAYVDAARPSESLIHDSLPWNSEELAESARRVIARSIIQVVVRIDTPDDEPPPLNVSVTVVSDDGEVERGYVSVAEVVKSEPWEAQVEREMLVHIKGVLRNHAWLPIAREILEQVERCEHESSAKRILAPV